MRKVNSQSVYRHFKGDFYSVLGVSKPVDTSELVNIYESFNTKHTESEKMFYVYKDNKGFLYHSKQMESEEVVLYKSLYKGVGVFGRPLNMFLSKVDKEKYPNAIQVYRMEEYKLEASIDTYKDLIENLEEEVEKEYMENLSSLNRSKEAILETIKASKEEGFTDTYFSTRIEFAKETKELKEYAIAGGCVRMLVFKKWMQEIIGISDVEIKIDKLDNYVVLVKAIVNHGL